MVTCFLQLQLTVQPLTVTTLPLKLFLSLGSLAQSLSLKVTTSRAGVDSVVVVLRGKVRHLSAVLTT